MRWEGEHLRPLERGGKVFIAETSQDGNALSQRRRHALLARILAPAGRAHEDQIKLGQGGRRDLEGCKQPLKVLARFACPRPQDVRAREAVALAELHDLRPSDVTHCDPVRDHLNARGLDPSLNAVIGRGLGGSDDTVGLGDRAF